MIFDKNGNLVNDAAFEAGRKISLITTGLMRRLFKQGMTIIEARALLQFLHGQLDTSALLELLKRQCNA